jgi:hypothetical protein
MGLLFKSEGNAFPVIHAVLSASISILVVFCLLVMVYLCVQQFVMHARPDNCFVRSRIGKLFRPRITYKQLFYRDAQRQIRLQHIMLRTFDSLARTEACDWGADSTGVQSQTVKALEPLPVLMMAGADKRRGNGAGANDGIYHESHSMPRFGIHSPHGRRRVRIVRALLHSPPKYGLHHGPLASRFLSSSSSAPPVSPSMRAKQKQQQPVLPLDDSSQQQQQQQKPTVFLPVAPAPVERNDSSSVTVVDPSEIHIDHTQGSSNSNVLESPVRRVVRVTRQHTPKYGILPLDEASLSSAAARGSAFSFDDEDDNNTAVADAVELPGGIMGAEVAATSAVNRADEFPAFEDAKEK